MPLRLGPLKLSVPWTKHDPYWDYFINAPPEDPKNMVAASIRDLPEGRVYPVKSELHSPDITTAHIKELATFLGSNKCAVVELKGANGAEPQLPRAVLFGLHSEYDPKTALGVGGQSADLKGGFVAFWIGSYIRELGYHATRAGTEHGERLAAAARMGVLDGKGSLRSKQGGPYLFIADVILTDLPLVADVEEASPFPPMS
jgi:hypothetical protein